MNSAGAGLAMLIANPRLLAEESSVASALRSMSVLTGGSLDERWVRPTADLVAAIVAVSGPLRALDLGEVEPATSFTAR